MIVYTLRDKDAKPLYVGKTADIDMRLAQHRRDKKWYAAIASVDTEIVDSPTRAKERERELIAALQPAHNSHLISGKEPRDRSKDGRPGTSINLSPDERELLIAISRKEGWSRSAVLATALIEYAKAHHPELEARRAAGAGEQGEAAA